MSDKFNTLLERLKAHQRTLILSTVEVTVISPNSKLKHMRRLHRRHFFAPISEQLMRH